MEFDLANQPIASGNGRCWHQVDLNYRLGAESINEQFNRPLSTQHQSLQRERIIQRVHHSESDRRLQ
jgi:hypothetical protein